MTSTQRVLAALRGEPVDRVPTMELYIDPKVINAIHPGISYEDFVDAEDLDGIACIAVVDDLNEVQWVDRDARLYRDKWGALQQMSGDEFLPLVQMPPRIETDEDLDNYTPPDPAKSPALRDAKRYVKRFKGKRAIVAVGEATFAPQQNLRGGLENLMFDYMDRPEFVERLARIGVEYYCELYRMMIAEGVEVVLLGDDYAGKTGPMISPATFRQFIEPGLTEVVKACHDAGALVIKHTDGNVWPIMDSLVASGADMFGPLEPPLMDLAEVRQKTGRGVMGNVDVDLLSRGTADQVRDATLDLLRRVSPLGGHIIASGNTVASYVNPRNYKVMLDTIKQHGSDFLNH